MCGFVTVNSKTFKTTNLFYSDELVDIGIDQELAFNSFCTEKLDERITLQSHSVVLQCWLIASAIFDEF